MADVAITSTSSTQPLNTPTPRVEQNEEQARPPETGSADQVTLSSEAQTLAQTEASNPSEAPEPTQATAESTNDTSNNQANEERAAEAIQAFQDVARDPEAAAIDVLA